MQPGDPGDLIDIQETLDERRLLNQLLLVSYTVTPGTIDPFQQATLAWNVQVPASVSSQVDVGFKINQTVVSDSGSLGVSPLDTSTFYLTAYTPLTSRAMGTKTVQVDLSDCLEASLPRAGIKLQAQGVKNLFVEDNLIWARGDLDVEMLPPDQIRIKLPLEVEIPSFFNADLDVEIDVAVSVVQRAGNRVVSARLADVSVDVVFHVAEHIFSLGLATAAQAMVQGLLGSLIKAFLRPQIEAAVAQPLQQIIDTILTNWRAFDPAKRTYRLYSLAVESSPAGLVIRGCPLPAPLPPKPERPPVSTGASARRRRGNG